MPRIVPFTLDILLLAVALSACTGQDTVERVADPLADATGRWCMARKRGQIPRPPSEDHSTR